MVHGEESLMMNPRLKMLSQDASPRQARRPSLPSSIRQFLMAITKSNIYLSIALYDNMSKDAPSAAATDSVTIPSPPFITVAGIPNFRDLGGYPVSYPRDHSIRREVIYRCAEPSNVTHDGITTMQRLGITHIYDLRSYNEIERNKAAGRGGVVEWEGCERVFVPVFEDKDYSPEALATRFKDYAAGGPEVSIIQYYEMYDERLVDRE